MLVAILVAGGLTVDGHVHGPLLPDHLPRVVMELDVELELILALVVWPQRPDGQRDVGLPEDQPLSVRHVGDQRLLVEGHQRGAHAAGAGVRPGALDLGLAQGEAGLHQYDQGLPLDAVVDGRGDVNELGSGSWGGGKRMERGRGS